MPDAADTLPTKERIMGVCAKLFLDKGYKKTTIADITRLAHVSNSSFQHFFRAKDGVLAEFVRYMYGSQFDAARVVAGGDLPPVRVYALETAIQLAITELDENLREVYLEAYTHEEALGIIHAATAKELYRIFGPYQPELSATDFGFIELGTAGMMRGFMARPCDEAFPFEEKLRCFTVSALRVFRVPEEEIRSTVAFLDALDVRGIARQVMEALFQKFSVEHELAPDRA